MGWVGNAKPRPLYPRERTGTHCMCGWVGPRAGLGLKSYRLTTKWDRVVLDKLTVARITKESHRLT